MSGAKHFRYDEMPFKKAVVGDQHTTIARMVAEGTSRTMGAGVERLENCAFEWTVTYDEILFIRSGRLRVITDGTPNELSAGDILWLPEGTHLRYEATEPCEYFYALYPVDWAKRQGVEEP